MADDGTNDDIQANNGNESTDLPDDRPTEAMETTPGLPTMPVSPVDEPTAALTIMEMTPVGAVVEPTTVMAATPATPLMVDDPLAPPAGLTSQQKRMAIIGGGAAAVLLIVILLVVGGGDDKKSVTAGSTTSTTTTVADTTTTAATSSTSVAASSTIAEVVTTVPAPSAPAASGPYPPVIRVAAGSVVFSPDGHALLTSPASIMADDPRPIALRDASTGAITATFGSPGDHAIAFSPDGSKVLRATTAGGGTAVIRTLASGAEVSFQVALAASSSATFSPDGSKIVIPSGAPGSGNGVWDAKTGELLRTVGVRATTAVFSPDGTQILTAGSGSDPTLWNAGTGEQIRSFTGVSGLERATFSPDGGAVLAIGSSSIGSVYDTATGEPRYGLPALGPAGTVALFSPDGTRILTGSTNGTLMLWDTSTGTTKAVLVVPDGLLAGDTITPLSAVFSRDGHKVAATFEGSGPFRVTVVFDVASGHEIIHVTDLFDAVFSPDGTRLAGVSDAANDIDVYAV